MNGTVVIIGAGVMGQVAALALSRLGWCVTLIDKRRASDAGLCSRAAAGLLSPFCELESSDALITHLGREALDLWPYFLTGLAEPVFFQKSGTLAVSHPEDRSELDRLTRKVRAFDTGALEAVSLDRLKFLEPELDSRFSNGLYFPHEGQIDGRGLLDALEKTDSENPVSYRFEDFVERVEPCFVQTRSERFSCDWVLDCRGLEGKLDWPKLRGVRGELFRVLAPEVRLNRPVRLIHPRYPLYIAPRPHQRFIIGATCLEDESEKPVTIRSTLELLSAAFSVHPGFAEGWVEESVTGWRPALPNHLPHVRYQKGLVRVNGLYRHGFLLAPVIAQGLVGILEGKRADGVFQKITEEIA